MRPPNVDDLPPPPPGRVGWPWTEGRPPLPESMADGRPWPTISIVTPSYQQGLFIEQTIRSVLLQGYASLEYIVIDGGSQDDSVEIIRTYQDWLGSWVSEPDGGQTDALNKGFARSHGAIMGWLNSDDLYMPGALGQVANAMRAHPTAELVYGGCDLIDADGHYLRPYWTLPFRRADVLRGASGIAQPAAFWRRSIWKRVGPLHPDYHYCMDLDLWMSIAERSDVVHCPQTWACFRMHDASKTLSGESPFEAE